MRWLHDGQRSCVEVLILSHLFCSFEELLPEKILALIFDGKAPYLVKLLQMIKG